MEQKRLSNIEFKAMCIVDYATRNQTPDFIVFWQLNVLANNCRQNCDEDGYQAVWKVISYLLEK